jgi:hypothetical protein
MKNIISSLLFVLYSLVSINAESQTLDRFPLLRERIIQAKLREIKLNLRLDQATFEQFRPVYLKYEHEISGINILNMARLLKADADSLSAEEADRLIVNQLECAKRLVEIREKYYKEFKTVLKPQQIIKLYQTEAELRKKVIAELQRRRRNR